MELKSYLVLAVPGVACCKEAVLLGAAALGPLGVSVGACSLEGALANLRHSSDGVMEQQCNCAHFKPTICMSRRLELPQHVRPRTWKLLQAPR